MDTEARRSRSALPLLAGLATIVAAFAGSASIGDRGAATHVAPVDSKTLTAIDAKALVGVGTVHRAVLASAAPSAVDEAQGSSADAAPRRRILCAGCGVVESITRVDRRELAGGFCPVNEWDGVTNLGSDLRGAEPRGIETITRTIRGMPNERLNNDVPKISTNYQIVVRFRDGSRRVFNEATPRAMRSGERVLVIAGANRPAT